MIMPPTAASEQIQIGTPIHLLSGKSMQNATNKRLNQITHAICVNIFLLYPSKAIQAN
jgi:hypothetical protein